MRELHTHPSQGRRLAPRREKPQAYWRGPAMRFICAVYLLVYHTAFRTFSSIFDDLDAYPSEKFIYAHQPWRSLCRTREETLPLVLPRARGQALSELIRISRRPGMTTTRHFVFHDLYQVFSGNDLSRDILNISGLLFHILEEVYISMIFSIKLFVGG